MWRIRARKELYDVYPMNDLQLQQAVTDELAFDPAADASHGGVFAGPGGAITLTGYVADYAQRHTAEAAARRIKGVRAGAQELQVRLPGHKQLADDEIAARAARILEWDLHTMRERAVAEIAAWSAAGVSRVINRIEIF